MAAPNWAPQAVGVEPPLGLDVNAVEPVGEPGEIAASLAKANSEVSDADPSLADSAALRPSYLPDVERAALAIPNPKPKETR